MKKLLFALLLASFLFAQGELAKKIAKLHQKHVEEDSPAVMLLVMQNETVLYQEGIGYADLEQRKKSKRDTLFYLASVSKSFTAMSILILAEQKKLTFQDSLAKYFPKFPDYAKKITIQHLLQHTSGLPDYIELAENFPENQAIKMKQILKALAKEKSLLFSPGEKYEYSNTGYLLLAQIVEKVSKNTFPNFVQSYIFKPLRMKNSLVVSDSYQHLPKLAIPYLSEEENFQAIEFGEDPLDLLYGDGGVLSSLSDMVHWRKALTTEILVKKASLKRAFQPAILNNQKKTDYGMGFVLEQRGKNSFIGHDGAWTGWNTAFCFSPSLKVTIVILSNNDEFDTEELMEDIIKLMSRFLKNAK